MKRGRPPARTLYRKRGSLNWLYYQPNEGTIDTNETDRFRAEQVMNGKLVVQHDVDPVRSALNEIHAQGRFASESENQTPQATSPVPETPSVEPVNLTPKVEPENVKTRIQSAFAKKLTPAKRDKLLGILATGVTHINALAVELGYSFLGRKLKDDYIVSNEDLELLKLGWELLIEDLFDMLEPKPWHVILIGNLFLIVAIAGHTEKKPKKVPERIEPNGTDSGTPSA